MKKLLAFAAILTMAAALTACGDDEHSFTYLASDGNAYSGTYSGDWKKGGPNGDGSFSTEDGSFTIIGSWSNGQPNGQCREILIKDGETVSYNGNYFYGVWQGSGEYTVKSDNAEIKRRGEYFNGKLTGEGEETCTYSAEYAAEYGGRISETYKGGFTDNIKSGIAEYTVTYTDEVAAEKGYGYRVYNGSYANDTWNGDAQLTIYYTDEKTAALGYDRMIYTGQCENGTFVEPYRYAKCNGNNVISEGRVRDGKFISDNEKAIKDTIYDFVDEATGDGVIGDLFDIFGPAFYDRNAS